MCGETTRQIDPQLRSYSYRLSLIRFACLAAGRTAPPTRAEPVAAALEHFRRKIRQPRAFAALQRDVAAVRPALEAVDDIGEAG